jgi:hypothetical protein
MKPLMLALLSAAVIPHCAMGAPSVTGEGATGIRCEFSMRQVRGPALRVIRIARLQGPLQEARLQARIGNYVLGVATKRGLSETYFPFSRQNPQLFSQLSVREPGQSQERGGATFGMYPWSSDVHTESGDVLDVACELF